MFETLRRIRRAALGMNRRNLEFLVPYNAAPLFAVVALEIVIGKWRGLRLLEYLRFSDLGRPPASAP